MRQRRRAPEYRRASNPNPRDFPHAFSGNKRAHGNHRSYTSLRCRIRVTSTSNSASSMVYTTR